MCLPSYLSQTHITYIFISHASSILFIINLYTTCLPSYLSISQVFWHTDHQLIYYTCLLLHLSYKHTTLKHPSYSPPRSIEETLCSVADRGFWDMEFPEASLFRKFLVVLWVEDFLPVFWESAFGSDLTLDEDAPEMDLKIVPGWTFSSISSCSGVFCDLDRDLQWQTFKDHGQHSLLNQYQLSNRYMLYKTCTFFTALD